MSKHTEKGTAFELEVEKLFRLKGYAVRRNEQISGTQLDLVVQKSDLLENLCFVIECTDRAQPVGVDLLKQKAAVLLGLSDSRFLFRLIYVSRSGFTPDAKTYAQSCANILLLTLQDLESELIDFRTYADAYIDNFEHSRGMFSEGKLFNNYVELAAKDEHDTLFSSISSEARRWLNDASNNLLFILGEYGTGKTSFARHFVYQMLRDKFRHHGTTQFTPIIINLRECRRTFNIRQVVTDTLVNHYGIRLPSFMAFERICSAGGILLVLDGFDEMAEAADARTLVDCFAQIYILAGLNAKIILTCRSNFFKSHADVVSLLKQFSVSLPAEDDEQSSVVRINFSRHGRVLYTEKLDQSQIRNFVEKRFGKETDKVLHTIKATHDLTDLSTRPVLLDMILTTLPELADNKKRINSASLYEHYTNKWTARDEWRVSLPLPARQSFCEILGWYLHLGKEQEITYEQLEAAMIRTLASAVEDQAQLERFKNDLQTCSFLVRTGNQGNFRFAHRSFLEFFVAKKIVSDLSGTGAVLKSKNDDIFREQQALASKRRASPHHEASTVIIGRPVTGYEAQVTRVLSTLDDRLKRGEVKLTRSNLGPALLGSHREIRTHLEAQLATLFHRDKLSGTGWEVRLSEEIATFALELLENSTISLKRFVAGLNPESLDLLSDILRLSKSVGALRQEIDWVKEYIETGKNDVLKTSFCAALAKAPDIVTRDLVDKARTKLSPAGWSYFLFELACRSDNHCELLREYFETPGLHLVDRVICAQGFRRTLDSGKISEICEPLVIELLASKDSKENSIGITFCQTLPYPRVFDLLTKVLKDRTREDGSSRQLKELAISVLGQMEGEEIWRGIRGLILRESDEQLKRLLQKAEQLVRDAASRKRDREGWDNFMTIQLRERMWKALRH
jgi:hypothetical protein